MIFAIFDILKCALIIYFSVVTDNMFVSLAAVTLVVADIAYRFYRVRSYKNNLHEISLENVQDFEDLKREIEKTIKSIKEDNEEN